MGTYGVLQSSYGVARTAVVLASASGDGEGPSLVTEVIEEMDSASEWYVVGQAVLVPGDRGVEETIALLADLPVPGLEPGMLALTGVFLMDLRRMTLFEGGSEAGSLFAVVREEKQRSRCRDRSMMATPFRTMSDDD